ncbi:RNA polymerase, sigma-24 subunit, ECF subfamily [Catenulispora acidiphila DSM 44928]|uniref:RNA polymerase, sigma-24 subunit, ECF subfamily n=1 Tax=Catenulispora acidiphila (strain DSM 44928 / JCM 14897 / NBRC 102108 / NRRL B-24433 / ID139908) TaxID=479433 RepID=C7Q141_CATAD|nr:SigE family RNA polymerase sigma factor [Catenulispora acidiphila]ACU71716.1 RNA polymerase, sigma-24 subunit, ECF subfamily [Catenulispora acidiphila DSM 44928]
MDAEQEQEFRAFVAARSRALTSTAYLLTGDAEQAADLVQSALAVTWVRWPKLKDRGRAEAYVRKTIYHAYVDRTRLFSWRRERSTAELPERADAGTDLAEAVARSHDVAALVRRLPRGQRAVTVLSYYEDRSDEEAAEVLGVSVSTVRTQRFKALRGLRVMIREEDRPAELAGREVIA